MNARRMGVAVNPIPIDTGPVRTETTAHVNGTSLLFLLHLLALPGFLRCEVMLRLRFRR